MERSSVINYLGRFRMSKRWRRNRDRALSQSQRASALLSNSSREFARRSNARVRDTFHAVFALSRVTSQAESSAPDARPLLRHSNSRLAILSARDIPHSAFISAYFHISVNSVAHARPCRCLSCPLLPISNFSIAPARLLASGFSLLSRYLRRCARTWDLNLSAPLVFIKA